MLSVHQDSQYFDSVDPSFSGGEVLPGLADSTSLMHIVSVWVSLVDATDETIGSLEVIPGSHRHGLFAGRRDEHNNMKSDADVEALLGEKISVPASKGDVILCKSGGAKFPCNN